MSLPHAIAAQLDALRAQRNREADTVAELNGLLAESQAEVRRLSAALADARAELDMIARLRDSA